MKTGYGELNIIVKGSRAMLAKADGLTANRVTVHDPAGCPPYKSKLEQDYAHYLMAQQHAKVVTCWRYESVRFYLAPRTSYRPDFMVQMGGEILFYEVKGWHKNRRDSLTHLKVAASMFPCFRFVLVTKERGQWVEKHIA